MGIENQQFLVPHCSFKYQGRELDYYDKEIECTSPHLLDSVHWMIIFKF